MYDLIFEFRSTRVFKLSLQTHYIIMVIHRLIPFVARLVKKNSKNCFFFSLHNKFIVEVIKSGLTLEVGM